MGKERRALPWTRFSYEEFFDDPAVAVMTNEQVGGYLRLLAVAWRADPPGRLPADSDYLAAISKLDWSVHGPVMIRAFDSSEEGVLIQRRIVREYEAAGRVSEAKAIGGRARHGQQTLANADGCSANAMRGRSRERLRENLSQPPSSPDGDGRAAELALDDPDREESPREWDEGFDPFWEEYPRKVAKAAARAAYARLRPRSQRNYDLLMDGLRLHIRKEWYGRDPDKIPHAATWLNQRRFTDAESEA